MKIVSACLVDINCKWNGKSNPVPKLIEELKEGKLLPLCPEQLGGLTIPRPSCGILDGVGKDVLDGEAKVIDHKGKDHTKKFMKGAREVLRIAKKLGIKEAILRTSPSCGVGKTWQMSRYGDKFRNRLVTGNGVVAALLKRNGIKVLSERDI